MKLNLACGENRIEGWENHDTDVDLTKPLPWPDNSVEFILLEHFLEHLSGPDGLRLLDECRRILIPGGILRVCVPVMERLSVDKMRDIILHHGHLVPYTEHTLDDMLSASGFEFQNVSRGLPLADCDGHWKVIGKDQDDMETYRVEAMK